MQVEVLAGIFWSRSLPQETSREVGHRLPWIMLGNWGRIWARTWARTWASICGCTWLQGGIGNRDEPAVAPVARQGVGDPSGKRQDHEVFAQCRQAVGTEASNDAADAPASA